MNLLDEILNGNIGKELLLLLISQLNTIGDKLVNGENLTDNEKRTIKMAYAANQIWFKHLANDTDTEIDNAFTVEIDEFCEDTAKEGSFSLTEDFKS